MDYLYCGQYLVVDLATGETEEEYLEEEEMKKHLGGMGFNLALYEKHADGDPIVFGSGILTASLVPGASASVMTAKSPVTGKLAHAPFTWHTGIEFKLSGFDFMVIKNAASNPSYLWVRDEIADVEDASDVWGKDTWATTDSLREELGEDRIQVLGIGPAGEKGDKKATVNVNYWGSGDRFGFGALLGAKKLKALCVRGMGELDINDPQGMVDRCKELLKAVKPGGMGMDPIMKLAGVDAVESWFKPLLHRYSADYNSPQALWPYLKYNEDPKTMKSSEVKEPGVLVNDAGALAALKAAGKSPEEAAKQLEKDFREGINPLASATGADGIAAWPGKKVTAEESQFSNWAPPTGDGWGYRNALCYTMGICPITGLLYDQLNEDVFAELINLGTGWELSADDVKGVVETAMKVA